MGTRGLESRVLRPTPIIERYEGRPFLSVQGARGTVRAVTVTLLPQNQTLTFSGSMVVQVLLRKLELLPESVMVIRGTELLTEDERVHADDAIEIRSVISGGV